MKTTKETFIRNLCRLRKSRFARQVDFAELVNLSERGYQKYEQGESSPTPEILDRFSAILECKPWQLVTPDCEDGVRHLDEMRTEALGYLITMEDAEVRKFLGFWRNKAAAGTAAKKGKSRA